MAADGYAHTMHSFMNSPVWSRRQQPLASTRREAMPVFVKPSTMRAVQGPEQEAGGVNDVGGLA